MGLNLTSAGVALTLLTITAAPVAAQSAVASKTAAQAPAPVATVKQAPTPTTPFVPADFKVPVLAKSADFKVVPLGPDLVTIDFDAYMSSIEHLQQTFSRNTRWPRENITASEAMQDMTTERARFLSRRSFAYAVLTPDGKRERGSVYVSPSPIQGYDATVKMWVTKAEYDAGFDAKLYEWVKRWIKRDWLFAKVAYPGRSIDWRTWDSLVAAEKAVLDNQTP